MTDLIFRSAMIFHIKKSKLSLIFVIRWIDIRFAVQAKLNASWLNIFVVKYCWNEFSNKNDLQ